HNPSTFLDKRAHPMKILTLMALVTLLAACTTPAATMQQPPQTTERSERAHQELDKEMNQ
ncbi:MAG: hypothetical protein RPR40_13585, partial [Bermanella sp.]